MESKVPERSRAKKLPKYADKGNQQKSASLVVQPEGQSDEHQSQLDANQNILPEHRGQSDEHQSQLDANQKLLPERRGQSDEHQSQLVANQKLLPECRGQSDEHQHLLPEELATVADGKTPDFLTDDHHREQPLFKKFSELEPVIRSAFLRQVTGPVSIAETDDSPVAKEPPVLAELADELFDQFRQLMEVVLSSAASLEVVLSQKNNTIRSRYERGRKLGTAYLVQTGRAAYRSTKNQSQDAYSLFNPAITSDYQSAKVDSTNYSARINLRFGRHQGDEELINQAAEPTGNELYNPTTPTNPDSRPPYEARAPKRKSSVLKIKSFNFGVRMIKLYHYLQAKREYMISNQIVRSGMSVGANVNEAMRAESLSDFIHKLSISHKELEETIYWMRLLKRGNYLPRGGYRSLRDDADELMRILGRSLYTARCRKRSLTTNH